MFFLEDNKIIIYLTLHEQVVGCGRVVPCHTFVFIYIYGKVDQWDTPDRMPGVPVYSAI